MQSSSSTSKIFANRMIKFSIERTWTIDGIGIYKTHKKPGYVLQSSEFTDIEHDMKFRIIFYPRGTKEVNQNNFYSYDYTAACIQSRNMTGVNWKGEAYVDYTIEAKLPNEENWQNSSWSYSKWIDVK